jgi:hypothetical protein
MKGGGICRTGEQVSDSEGGLYYTVASAPGLLVERYKIPKTGRI